MIFVFVGIAAWLAVAVVVSLVFVRTLALKEGDDAPEPDAEQGGQLQLVNQPASKRERAA